MSDTPFISVIITTYNRKKYLVDAVKSAYNQTLPKDKYEIIVTKNFNDDIIDSFIKEHGGRRIFFKGGTQGRQLTDALRYTKGEVICFLDDDDLFEKEKLETIYKLFKKDTNLVYINNARHYIDENCNILFKGTNKFEKDERVYIHGRSLFKLLKLELQNSPWYNSSSISIRKYILLKYLNVLKITNTLDLFLYLISLDSQNNLLLLDKKLTKYRMHSSSSLSLTTYSDFKKVTLKISSSDLRISRILYKNFKRPEIKKYLKIHIREKSIDYLFYKCNCRRSVLLNYILNLPYLAFARPKINLLRGLQILLYIISPEKFRNFNYIRTKNYFLRTKSK